MAQSTGTMYSNWTDDLQRCRKSGVGSQGNQIYKPGGGRGEVFMFEDTSGSFNHPDDCFLYCVFDGHEGDRVANFSLQRFPAELLLGQLGADYSDDDVIKQLKQAFDSVDRGFLNTIDEAVIEKLHLETQLLGISEYDVYTRYPNFYTKLKELNANIAGGCSAAIALIFKDKLYVANVGDTRLILCRQFEGDPDLGVVQLSTDHTIHTTSELQRLANLGLEIELIQRGGVLQTTRSLGDWRLKGGYKEIEPLKPALDEPVISKPFIHGGEAINPTMQFMFIMTKGLYKAYEEATGTDQVNTDIASMIDGQMKEQTTMEGVAQAVVDRICRLHQDKFSTSNGVECLRRDDMTLLVRRFSASLRSPINNLNSNLQKKSEHLRPLIIPQTTGFQTVSTTSSPSSTDGSSAAGTPSTLPGSTTTSPITSTHNQPFANVNRPLRGGSPLTVTIRPNAGHPVTSPLTIPNLPSIPQLPDTDNPQESILMVGQIPNYEVPPPPEERPPRTRPTLGQRDSNGSHSSSNSNHASIEDRTSIFNRPSEQLTLDDGKVAPYVDFSEFSENVELAGGESFVFSEIF